MAPGLPTPPDGGAPGYFGVYPALVADIVDPESLGRVQVHFPWLGTDGDRDVRAWATLCSPYADQNQGLLALPEVGSQVVVAFEAGNLRRPYVIGSCWNGKETLPHPPEQANNIRLLRSREDSRLELDDTAGAAAVRLTLASGHAITMDSSGIEIRAGSSGAPSAATVKVSSDGSVTVTATQITLTDITGLSSSVLLEPVLEWLKTHTHVPPVGPPATAPLLQLPTMKSSTVKVR